MSNTLGGGVHLPQETGEIRTQLKHLEQVEDVL